jgi:tetratricopeptide (TPR) repeat protein
VARHLIVAGRLVDTDPETALAHAYAARAHAARIGAVREAVGVTAYHAGEWAVALAELRAVRRMNGSVEHLPVEADCERALGRPDRALELQRSADADRLDQAGRIELLIVAAGARRDLGQLDSAAVMLQVPELEALPLQEWSARLRYAYADALLEAGRAEEARNWFERTLEIDPDGETGVTDRLLELDGVVLDDFFDEDDQDDQDDEDGDDEVEENDDQAGDTDANDGTAEAVAIDDVVTEDVVTEDAPAADVVTEDDAALDVPDLDERTDEADTAEALDSDESAPGAPSDSPRP